MRRPHSWRLLIGLLICSFTSGTSAAAQGDPPASQTTQADADQQLAVQAHWAQAKRLLAGGAYQEALRELEIILRLAPNDPKALSYRQLCQKRLSAGSQFRRLSVEELERIRQVLERERLKQVRAAAQAKALERQIRQEQDRWDAHLKQLHQDAERARAAQPRRKPARRPEAPRAKPAPGEALVEPPKAPPPGPPVPPEPAVEAPIAQPEAVAPPAPLPSPADLPPGAIQIFADQLSASTDRRLAVARGHVHVIFSDGFLTCDKATLFTDTKDVYAEGRVYLERERTRVEGRAAHEAKDTQATHEGTEGTGGPQATDGTKEVFRGDVVHYNTETKKGRFLDGTAGQPPWYHHGEVIEHIAEGVLRVRYGHVTSCELDPAHFRFAARSATVFADDQIVRGRNVTLAIEDFPLIYLPWLSVANRQSPFFLIPGKKKPWEQFALMGYRYEWPEGHEGALRWDWRRAFAWGLGVDHRFEDERWGKGLVKVYYNDEHNMRRKEDDLPKGAGDRRYRVLVRHLWQAMPDTQVVTDIQEFSDEDFRKEFLFREEFASEDQPESFVSIVTSNPDFSINTTIKKRMNRFQTVTEAFPDATLDLSSKQVGETQFFADSKLGVANLQTKTRHSNNDTDVVQLDWFQKLRYAMNWFRPVLITPNAGVRQTYYTKDIQSGATALTNPSTDRPQGKRDLISGQFSAGADASLKLFRIFPVVTNRLGLNLNLLRHVLTPTVAHSYIHQPTVPNALLDFAAASSPTNQVTFGLENKLQTKRPGKKQKLRSVDLARFVVSLPYTFHGHGNKQGGRIGDWGFDLETYLWPWLRLETDWTIPSHFVKGTRDDRIQSWNVDLIAVGGEGETPAVAAPDIQAPTYRRFEAGQQLASGIPLLPVGQWYLGLGHRYSQDNKTEDVLQFDWRLTEKWQINTFHRFTWKEVRSGSKRFRNVREYQYVLTRDLHDWVAELVYRVDREAGEELFLTLTLKAYPNLPIAIAESYHEPKAGSQSSPFSPVPGE